MKNVKRNGGFVMAGVLATLVMIPISLYTYLSIFRTSIKGERTISGQFEYKNINRSLLQVLSNEKVCPGSLTGSHGEPFTFPSELPLEVRIGSQRLAYVGKKIGSAVITDLHFDTISGPTVVSDGIEYVVALKVEADMQRDFYGSPKLSNKENPVVLNMKTDSDGKVVACSGVGFGGGSSTVAEAFLVSNKNIPQDSHLTPKLVIKKGQAEDFEMVPLRLRKGDSYTFYSGLTLTIHGEHMNLFGLRCKTENGWKFVSCSEGTLGNDGYVGDLWSLDGGCVSNDWAADGQLGMELRVTCSR